MSYTLICNHNFCKQRQKKLLMKFFTPKEQSKNYLSLFGGDQASLSFEFHKVLIFKWRGGCEVNLCSLGFRHADRFHGNYKRGYIFIEECQLLHILGRNLHKKLFNSSILFEGIFLKHRHFRVGTTRMTNIIHLSWLSGFITLYN